MVEFDVVVIDVGHNGLVASTYLAKVGLRVGVLERAPGYNGAHAVPEDWKDLKGRPQGTTDQWPNYGSPSKLVRPVPARIWGRRFNL